VNESTMTKGVQAMANYETETYERRRISCVLTVLLQAAGGGGMSYERAEAIYQDICCHYGRMRAGFCQVLAQELRRCLALTDKELGDAETTTDGHEDDE
jgi:hypothetical protein